MWLLVLGLKQSKVKGYNMAKVKGLMMDVEDFVYDFYTKDCELTESPKTIINKAIEKFGWSFGSYAGDVIAQAEEENGASWEFEKVNA